MDILYKKMLIYWTEMKNARGFFFSFSYKKAILIFMILCLHIKTTFYVVPGSR